MLSKKILLVGDGNHQFNTNYVHWLNKTGNYNIDILSILPVKKDNRKFYNKIYTKNDDSFCYRIISKIKGVRRFYRFHLYKKLLNTLPEYDYIHFHFISVESFFLINQFKKNKKNNIILTIWGSDMYRIKSSHKKSFISACKKANVITFTNQKSIDFFKSEYNWRKNNLELCRFGLAPLENLKKLSLSTSQSKNKLNWNANKLAVTIGYNLSPGQQHIKILQQFKDQKVLELKDKIQLILPITYGNSPKYKSQLLAELNQLPFEYKIYDSFLSNDDVALIRKASDIMIQLQKTDQFSGSMQEYLFTRNIVITGSWLPYESMKQNGAWFLEIDEINDLKKVFLETIYKFKESRQETINNPDVILKLSLWQNNIRSWINLYSK